MLWSRTDIISKMVQEKKIFRIYLPSFASKPSAFPSLYQSISHKICSLIFPSKFKQTMHAWMLAWPTFEVLVNACEEYILEDNLVILFPNSNIKKLLAWHGIVDSFGIFWKRLSIKEAIRTYQLSWAAEEYILSRVWLWFEFSLGWFLDI